MTRMRGRQEMNNINVRIKEIINKVKHLMNGDLSNPTEHLNTIVTNKVIDINGILYNILRILNNEYILSRHCRGIEVEVYKIHIDFDPWIFMSMRILALEG